jgi:ABC-type multidrug transport system fused ATPase/permease subunit
VGQRLNYKVRTGLLRNILSQDIAYFDSVNTGDLLSRLSYDCTNLTAPCNTVGLYSCWIQLTHSLKAAWFQPLRLVSTLAPGFNPWTCNAMWCPDFKFCFHVQRILCRYAAVMSLAAQNFVVILGGLTMCFWVCWRLAMVSFAVAGLAHLTLFCSQNIHHDTVQSWQPVCPCNQSDTREWAQPYALVMPITFLIKRYARWSQTLNREISAMLGLASNVANEALGNIRTVRAVSAEEVEFARYEEHAQVGLPLPGGCQIGYTERTGCHQLGVLTAGLPTPGGCQIGYTEHTGCHQRCFDCKTIMRSANPTRRRLWERGSRTLLEARSP